jgi:hypothetical protein
MKRPVEIGSTCDVTLCRGRAGTASAERPTLRYVGASGGPLEAGGIALGTPRWGLGHHARGAGRTGQGEGIDAERRAGVAHDAIAAAAGPARPAWYRGEVIMTGRRSLHCRHAGGMSQLGRRRRLGRSEPIRRDPVRVLSVREGRRRPSADREERQQQQSDDVEPAEQADPKRVVPA